MAGHQIVIKINPDGSIAGEVKGAAGPKCTLLSKWLDELGKVTEDRKTSDFYKPDGQGVSTFTGQ